MYETGKYNFKDLDTYFNKGLGTCRGLLERRGYKAKSISEINRKYSLKEDFFDKIDSEEKAYMLGFIYADGCNFPEGTRVVIGLQEKDKTLLETFKTLLNYDRPLYYRKASTSSYRNSSAQYILTISSKRISDKLTKLGAVKAKSLILTFPSEDQVPESLHNHFIRGYFDGDGCITGVKPHFSRNSKLLEFDWSVVGTFDFVSSIQKIMVKELNLTMTKIKKHRNVFYLEYSGNKQCKKIAEWMYKDSSIFLERKYEKFKSIK